MATDRDLIAVIDPQLRTLTDASRWWVALSGGSDSVALLDLVHRWCRSHAGPELCVVHVNHALQAQADNWAALCAQHASQRGLAFRSERVTVQAVSDRGLEAAARKARYQVFEEVVAEGDVLLMAHHADDQAETILYRLLRGAGPRGLAGMPVARSLGAGRLCRPLLSVPRASLDAYVQAQQLPCATDASNDDLRFDRNFLRHEVLPQLRSRWPGLVQTLSRAGELQRQAVSALEDRELALVSNTFGDQGLRWDARDPDSLAAQLHLWLSLEGVPSPPRQRLQEFARQVLEAAPDTLPSLAVDGYRLIRWQGLIWRTVAVSDDTRERHDADADADADADVMPATVTAGRIIGGSWGVLRWHLAKPGERGIPEGTVLSLQTRPAGASVAPPGGPNRPFKQFARERGVPPWWRDYLPWLMYNEQPVAVAGAGLLTAVDDLPIPADAPLLLPHWTPATIADSIE